MWSRLGIGFRLHRVKSTVNLGFINEVPLNSTVNACLVRTKEDRPMVFHCTCAPDNMSQLTQDKAQLTDEMPRLTGDVSQLTADET